MIYGKQQWDKGPYVHCRNLALFLAETKDVYIVIQEAYKIAFVNLSASQ